MQTIISFHNCEFCGQPIQGQKLMGRKRLYCSDYCKHTASLIRTLDDRLLSIRFTEKNLKVVKGDLFAIVNSLHSSKLKCKKD